MDHIKHIKRAIKICGGSQSALARKADVTQAAISQLLSNGGKVSAETALKIEKATEGQVTRSQLRPDLFGAAA